ncbi:DMT family transporter [Endozoicomonas numazuensis]|uniref:Membrane protein n=1 Tax=Endozoicomonas numazuensis TaxID=1137799 RepID=A0A081NDN1_9GAMM|nr:DMT family transporter [Endozoicomonas numazuensis]KEQ16554.1 membrane protein [Endozoicomonas numazuensis]
MYNIALYALTVMIWGSTWIAITFQLGEVPVPVSIIYRFAIAGLVLFVILGLTRNLQKLDRKDHFYTLLQGGCLFCFNFYCFYSSIQYINSGLSSVVFSVATVTNCVANWLFYKKKPSLKVVTGSIVGLIGISAMFWPEFSSGSDGENTLKGVLLAMLGTVFFSMGNMISIRHQNKGLKPPSTNAWGMLYGVLVLTLVTYLQGIPFVLDWRSEYIAALLYLAIPGSVVVFTSYLLLVSRIGADRAAYATVLFPAVALTLSTIFEGYQWSSMAIFGFVLVALGNLIIFFKWPLKQRPAVRAESC